MTTRGSPSGLTARHGYGSATSEHQALLGFLLLVVGGFVRQRNLGRVAFLLYAMRARPDGPAREPDLMFVSTEHLYRLSDSHLTSPADLVVEIAMENSVGRDFVEKLREYESVGIREYWVIDNREGHERAEFFVHDGERLVSTAANGQGVYRSTVIAGLWLRTGWLFDESTNPVAALAEVEAGPPA